jgi:histidine triad (HIT) family protein
MTDRDPDCLFCRIAADEIPSDRLHTDDEVIAFRDIAPRAPTHVLIIPRRHIPDAHALTDADGPLVAKLFAVVRAIADEAGLGDGYRVVTNVGPDAGQSVPHLHFHLLGGRTMAWPPG